MAMLKMAHIIFHFDTFFFFSDKIVDGWERTETDHGVPYYVK